MQKYFRIPFATSGDRTAVADAVDPSGLVTYTEGYGTDYQRPRTDPQVRNIERDRLNSIMFELSTAIAELQSQGVPDFITTALNGGVAYSYNQYAFVRYSGGVYFSLVNGNTALPSDATKWAPVPLTFTQAGANAATRLPQDKAREIFSVTDFAGATTTIQFQNALNAAAAVNGYVRVPAGVFNIGNLTFPAGLKGFYGAGKGATRLVVTGVITAFVPFLYFGGLTDFYVGGFTIEMNAVTYSSNHTMQFGSCAKGTVEKIEIIGGGFINVYAPTCVDVTFDDIFATTCASSHFIADTSPSRLVVNNLKCLAYGNGHNIAITGGDFHRVSHCYAPGAGAAFFSMLLYQTNDSVIESCFALGITRECFQITDGSRNKLVDNTAWCLPGHNDFGISIFAENADIANCDCSGNTVYQSGKSGIALVSTSSGTPRASQLHNVGNNTIVNPNQINEAFGAGVILYGGSNCTANTVQNNTCVDTSNKMRYGVNEWNLSGNPDNNRIIHNSCLGGSNFISEANLVGANSQAFDLQWQNFATVVTSLTGTITTVDTANSFLKYKRRGRSAEISAQAKITTNGTGAGTVLMSLPTALRIKNGAPTGREQAVTGKLSYGYDGGVGLMRLVFYDGTYPGANGAQIGVVGTVEI